MDGWVGVYVGGEWEEDSMGLGGAAAGTFLQRASLRVAHYLPVFLIYFFSYLDTTLYVKPKHQMAVSRSPVTIGRRGAARRAVPNPFVTVGLGSPTGFFLFPPFFSVLFLWDDTRGPGSLVQIRLHAT